MKKKCLMAAVFLLASGALYAQTQKDFIRNYKAPDFKFRRLTASLNSVTKAASANNMIDTLSSAATNGRGGLSYYEIRNSSKYQGTFTSQMSGEGALGHVNKINFGQAYIMGSLDYTGRFYLKEKFFIRASSGLGIQAFHSSTKNELISDQTWIRYSASTSVAAGYGRVEYSSFARKAIDVEFLLKKADRINNDLTTAELTEIADNLDSVNYKRGFDNRLLRIWRLEQMDSIIGGLDIVTKRDMRYMAFLSDAMDYSPSLSRLSGSRIEAGAGYQVRFQQLNAPTMNNDLDQFTNVFVQYAAYIPTSYAFQHTISAGFIAEKYTEDMQSPEFEGRLFGRYQFG